jgi:hypothetical protein
MGVERGETSPDIVNRWSFSYEGFDKANKGFLSDREGAALVVQVIPGNAAEGKDPMGQLLSRSGRCKGRTYGVECVAIFAYCLVLVTRGIVGEQGLQVIVASMVLGVFESRRVSSVLLGSRREVKRGLG